MPDEFFEEFQNLCLLNLSKCYNISTLPSSISCLPNLEHLLLPSCTDLSILPSCVPPLEKLLVLDLSDTKLIKIPGSFFQHMHKLQYFNLSFSQFLTSLPMSNSNLVNLKKLNLGSCTSLMNVAPSLQQLSSSLKELDLSNCTSLQDVKNVSSSFGDILPNLQSLNFSSPKINFFSIRGCPSLETLTLAKYKDLEVLDLSGTKIKRLPLEDAQDLISLRHMDLLGVKHIRSVKWGSIIRLPQEVNWDQCGDGNTSHLHFPVTEQSRDGNRGEVFISARNARIFESLTSLSQLWEDCLNHFHVYIFPCNEQDKQKELPIQKVGGFLYQNIHSRFKPIVPCYKRCLEIEEVKKLPKGIAGVLSHTEFLSLHDESVVASLSDLGIENMAELRDSDQTIPCHESRL